ncbi:MAG TPA: hypothetical protein VFR37_15020 [Longimicrobium sp.]|nr:hypothetical protein [Longimicrobium sp.]
MHPGVDSREAAARPTTHGRSPMRMKTRIQAGGVIIGDGIVLGDGAP